MATFSITCGNCGRGVAADVRTSEMVTRDAVQRVVRWLQCPNCKDGSVTTIDGGVWPPAPAGGAVDGLPDDVAQAWREARTAHAVAAYTASEIMCRKILMHLAVDVAGSKAGGTFVSYVDDLNKAGYVGTGLKDAVTKVKDRGNTANHELPASTEADSLATLKITEHLLRGIYEIPGL